MHFENTHKFKSLPLFGGTFFSGDTIEITEDIVTLRRNRLFSKEFYSISFPLTNIINVRITKLRRGAEIIVQSQSQNQIISRGYRYSDVRRMKQLLTN